MVRKFEARANGPDLFGKQGPFLTDDETLDPGSMFLGDCGKLDPWHTMPSNPLSMPKHQRRADS